MQQEQKKKNDELRAEKEKGKELKQVKVKEEKSAPKEENAQSDDGSKAGMYLCTTGYPAFDNNIIW